ncbi:hypothetical protein AB7188_00965 [Providencia rettgeri]|uniref:hypothetical protein n=1 Tax=Providencia TaxID=586 RepID=UPI00234BAA2A|nr:MULTISPECIES: hypothetical protein [Providencia]MDH2396999.1 hypothetical protein [Providencia rettgeri]
MSTNIAVGICVLISIPFLWTFFSKFFKLQKKSFCLFLKNIYLDESSLHQQPLFWLLITLPVIVSITLWSIISSEYKLEWTAHGYAGLIKYSQLPLMMLALSPILGAFVISAHRSLQTFTQINATNKQIDTASKQLETARKQFEEAKNKNRVDMYFAKRKYLYEQIQAVKTEKNEEIGNPVLLCFNALETKDYRDSKNDNFIKDINIEIKQLILELDKCSNFFSEDIQNNPSKDHFWILNGNNIKTQHPLEKVDQKILKIKNKFYVELNDDKQKIGLYQRYCEYVECMDELNSREVSCEGDRAAQRSEIDYETQEYLFNATDVLIDFLNFIQIVFSNLYRDDQIDSLIPALTECKQKCLGWKNNAN